MKLWFGKYKDVNVEDVPSSYLKWMLTCDHLRIKELAEKELFKRVLLEFKYSDDYEDDYIGEAGVEWWKD